MQNANKSSKSNRKALNSRAEAAINVGLIEANEKGIASIKRGSHLAIKIAKKSSSIEIASVAVKKHAGDDQLFCGSDRNSHSEVFQGKGVLKTCSKFTGEHPGRSAISIKLQSNWAWVFSCKFAAFFQNTFS